MASIVTYDLTSKHSEVKNALKKLGYVDRIPGNKCKYIYFPNTTLHHSTKTPNQCKEDVQKICKSEGVSLERLVATKWDGWSALCGTPFE